MSPVEGTVRDRRRAETVGEIKQAALRQLTEAGTGGLSLRGVAREVGMTVQSLYHYFSSRDDLLTALVADAHGALADAVQGAASRSQHRPRGDRLTAVCQAYRRWALDQRAAFLLIYGTPVPGYRAPVGGGTTAPAGRVADGFLDAVFGGWSPDQLAGVRLPGVDAADFAHGPSAWSLPPGALMLFLDLRARLHGAVMLEVLGQGVLAGRDGEAAFAAMVGRMTDDVERSRRASSGR